MSWRLEIIEAAQEDLRHINKSVRLQVYKALEKVLQNPHNIGDSLCVGAYRHMELSPML